MLADQFGKFDFTKNAYKHLIVYHYPKRKYDFVIKSLYFILTEKNAVLPSDSCKSSQNVRVMHLVLLSKWRKFSKITSVFSFIWKFKTEFGRQNLLRNKYQHSLPDYYFEFSDFSVIVFGAFDQKYSQSFWILCNSK